MNHLIKSLATGLHQGGGVATTVTAPDQETDSILNGNNVPAWLSVDVHNNWITDKVEG
jgi:hypothetical protein